MELMKLVLVWISLAVMPLSAQVTEVPNVKPTFDTVDNQEWQREYKESIGLAIKLYPELKNPGNQLEAFIDKNWPDPKLFPKLAGDSFAPLFYATVAAQELGIAAQWPSLNEADKALVFQEITFHSKLVFKTVCAESQQIAELTERPHYQYVSPVTSDFDPNNMTNPAARQAFSPTTESSTITPPATEPAFLPPAPIIIDPQTGDTDIVTY